MQFAQPWLLLAGAVGAALITALHFLSVRTPPELLLPTARFLDEGEVRAVSQSARPSDLLLLALRIAALLLAATALAGPRWAPTRSDRLALVVADAAWRRDSAGLARALGLGADGMASSTVTRFVWSDTVDARGQRAGLRVDVAAALPLALRAAAQQLAVLPAIDSVSLYVVVPNSENVRARGVHALRAGALGDWRSQWPGAIRLYGDSTRPRDLPVRLRFDSVGVDDPVRAALALHVGSAPGATPGRLVVLQRARETDAASTPSSTPSSTSPADSGSVTIVWPRDGLPTGWTVAHDSAAAVVANGVALVSRWRRSARAPSVDGANARPIAWWNEGEVAALERRIGSACVRDVGVPLDAASDLLLDVNAGALLRTLAAPCGAAAGTGVPTLLRIDTTEFARPATAAALRGNDGDVSASRSLVMALLGAALLALLVETIVRSRSGDGEGAAVTQSRRGVRAS